jgi:hypothetical protein
VRKAKTAVMIPRMAKEATVGKPVMAFSFHE